MWACMLRRWRRWDFKSRSCLYLWERIPKKVLGWWKWNKTTRSQWLKDSKDDFTIRSLTKPWRNAIHNGTEMISFQVIEGKAKRTDGYFVVGIKGNSCQILFSHWKLREDCELREGYLEEMWVDGRSSKGFLAVPWIRKTLPRGEHVGICKSGGWKVSVKWQRTGSRLSTTLQVGVTCMLCPGSPDTSHQALEMLEAWCTKLMHGVGG